MNKLKNEEGYALLITLGTIILITLFLTSFQVIAVNNAKQIQRSDETYEATSIAEMGIEYYEEGATYIVEQYMDTNTERGKITQKTVADINKYINSQKNKPINQSIIDNYKKILIEIIIRDLNTFFETEPDDVFYKIIAPLPKVSESYALQPEYHKWSFIVEGKTPNSTRTQKIGAEFNLEDFEIIVKAMIVENDGEQSIMMPEQKFATENKTNLSVGSFSGNDFKVGHFDPKNGQISALGNVNITGMNNMNGLEIVANGNVKINEATSFKKFNLSATTVNFNNLNAIIDSNINVFGNASIATLSGFSNSKVFVKGDLNVSGKLELNSTENSVTVLGNATIDTLNNSSSSNIYIGGGLTVKNLQNSQGSVNVNGTLKVTSANTVISGGAVVVDKVVLNFSPINKEDFKVKGTGNTPAKLCIKDIGNIGVLKNKVVMATGQGEIIFLDKTLDVNSPLVKIDAKDYKDIHSSDLTGHNYVAGLNEFNKACGIATAETEIELYKIQDQSIEGVDKVKYID